MQPTMDSSSSSPRGPKIELALSDPVRDGLFKFGLGDVTIAAVYKDRQVTGTVNTYAMALASPVSFFPEFSSPSTTIPSETSH